MVRRNCDNFHHLFVNDIPLMDTRAPVEFNQGAFPMANNQPLMMDDERTAVGTCYKQNGQQAAIELGHSLVTGELKDQRIKQWKAFCEANPSGYLYCFRGGLRSKITQQWLKEAGIDYPIVLGGYKALRRYLIDTIEQVAEKPITVIAGNTGCGKTIMINTLVNGIDLEGAAHHRGSSFGRFVTEQRSQINFENHMAVQILKAQDNGATHFVYEDEGSHIGSAMVPLSLSLAMRQAKMVVIDDPFEIRLSRIVDEYIINMQREFVIKYGEQQGWTQFSAYLAKGMFDIRKRLGFKRYKEMLNQQQQAIATMQNTGSTADHCNWLVPLMKQYYDPMYRYQLSKKADRIVFRGDYSQVKSWLE